MKTAEIDEDINAYRLKHISEFGELPSRVLRRLLGLSRELNLPQTQAELRRRICVGSANCGSPAGSHGYFAEAAIRNAISATRLPTPRSVLRLPSSFPSSSPCDCIVPPQWSPGLPSPTRIISWEIMNMISCCK